MGDVDVIGLTRREAEPDAALIKTRGKIALDPPKAGEGDKRRGFRKRKRSHGERRKAHEWWRS